MSFLTWIILGLIAGYLANKIVNRRGEGAVRDMLLGIVGAPFGEWIFTKFGARGLTGFGPYSILVAVVGSVILLFLYHAIPVPCRLPSTGVVRLTIAKSKVQHHRPIRRWTSGRKALQNAIGFSAYSRASRPVYAVCFYGGIRERCHKWPRPRGHAYATSAIVDGSKHTQAAHRGAVKIKTLAWPRMRPI